MRNPLIVHVTKSKDALDLLAAPTSMDCVGSGEDETRYDMQQQQQKIENNPHLGTIAQSFFPGPLLPGAQAYPSIHHIIMDNTGCVTCYLPSHCMDRALIGVTKAPSYQEHWQFLSQYYSLQPVVMGPPNSWTKKLATTAATVLATATVKIK